MWWWKTNVPNTNNTYWYSDYEINLDSIYYNSSSSHKANWVTKFEIKY